MIWSRESGEAVNGGCVASKMTCSNMLRADRMNLTGASRAKTNGIVELYSRGVSKRLGIVVIPKVYHTALR